MKKTVGFLTTFYEWSPQYSLTSVVHDQLVAHVKNGYRTVLFVLESFKDDDKVPKGVEIRKVLPQIILEPYSGMSYPDSIQEDVDKIASALKEHCRDIDFIVAHDWIFIDTYLPYNMGLREAELPAKQFHWIHSAPSPRPDIKDNHHANRYSLPRNSKLVYLNHDKALALAEMYATPLNNVKVVNNSTDPRTFWELDPIVKTMIDKYSLLDADIISVYPVSTPRMVDGKQIDIVIKIHGFLKKLGYKTRLIVPNAHANAEREKNLVKGMQDLAKNQGLTPYEVIFTSTDGHEHGIPRNAVSDLFRLANLFIFPSTSENCSLILLEAMLSGNLLVLNKDCSGMQEFGGESALYFKFGNLDMGTRNYEKALNKPQYLEDIAKIIKSELENNKMFKAGRRARQKYNYDVVFSQIETLYYEQ